jgi:hypothetical protein
VSRSRSSCSRCRPARSVAPGMTGSAMAAQAHARRVTSRRGARAHAAPRPASTGLTRRQPRAGGAPARPGGTPPSRSIVRCSMIRRPSSPPTRRRSWSLPVSGCGAAQPGCSRGRRSASCPGSAGSWSARTAPARPPSLPSPRRPSSRPSAGSACSERSWGALTRERSGRKSG